MLFRVNMFAFFCLAVFGQHPGFGFVVMLKLSLSSGRLKTTP